MTSSPCITTLSWLQHLRETFLVQLHRVRAQAPPSTSLYRHVLGLCEQFDPQLTGSMCQTNLMAWTTSIFGSEAVAKDLEARLVQCHAYFTTGEALDYELLMEFIFFPIRLVPLRLELDQFVGDSGLFRVHNGWITHTGQHKKQSSVDVLVYEIQVPRRLLHTTATIFNDDEANHPPKDQALEFLEAIAECRFHLNGLRLVKHPNLLAIHGTIQTRTAMYLVYESFPTSCPLKTLLESFGSMKEPMIRQYLVQLMDAIVVLHAHEVTHGHLDCESVLIDSYGRLKVTSYGLKREFRHLLSTLLTEDSVSTDALDWTVKYPPPEVAQKEPSVWSRKSDMWTIGILILQMLCGYGKTNIANGSMAVKTKSSPNPIVPSTASKPLRSLLRACLQDDPKKRPTASELLQMEFFNVDPDQDVNDMLQSVCTDLDASMRKFMASSSAHRPMATRASTFKTTSKPSAQRKRTSVMYNY